MVEVFKTNVQEKQSQMLHDALCEAFPAAKINFDLSDCDRILRVEGDAVEALSIIALVNEHGITCTILD